jgi:TonB family protein
MRRRSLEEVFSPNPTLPLMAALGFHCLLFILNPTVLKRGTTSFGELPPMVIHMQDKLPVLAPPIPKPEVKPPPKPKPKPVPKKKAGLAPKTRPQPAPLQAKPKPVLHRTFISKVELPKFVPQDNDEILASSPRPDLAAAAPKPMARAPMASPLLHAKSRGIISDDVHFQLVDKSSLSGSSARTVAIPIGEERGDIPALPASTLHNAPKGIQGGYRFTPGEGKGELAGLNKSGYHGAIQTTHTEEGGISASGAARKTIRGNGFEISGSVGDRKILSRAIPEYPAWAEEKGITAAVQIYFTVRPDGTIRSTLRIQKSSGYAELDQLAKDALMKWRFSPSEASDESVSWGEITFRFTLA